MLRAHPLFRREDYDVYCEVPISIVKAALGGEIIVPTLEGKVELKIPTGTQSRRHFRLRNKGIAHVRGTGRGDQYVEVVIETPTHLTNRQKELLKEFEEEESKVRGKEKNYPSVSKFVDKLKELFE